MLRRKVYASASLLIAVAALLFANAVPAMAATTSSSSASGGNGLRISPVRTDLTIDPGYTQTIDVYVTNLTSQSANLSGVVDDFTAGTDESGTPAVLLNGDKAPSHSLKEYVAPIGNFTLAASATKDVKVTISIPKGVAGGGYFGAVRFMPASTVSAKNVNLAASVASLVIVTVPGPVTQQLSISSFDVRRMNTQTNVLGSPNVFFTNNKNLNAVVRFDNTGNLQEEPFGKILLKKGSAIIGTYEINNTQPLGNVLPDSIRRFSVPLTGLSSFGKYTIEGNFGYGTTGQLLSAVTTFYIVPVTAVVIAVVVLLIIIVGIYLLRTYIRNAIRKGVSRGNR
jgi:hypothetical protein